MKRLKIFFILLAATGFAACDSLEEAVKELPNLPANTPLTQEEVARGLKNALTVGTDTAVKRLTAVDGYFKDAAVKILLPPEAQKIMEHVAKIPGGQQLVDKAILALNRAAEDAAQTATPIFVNAITNMTISDAFNILKGNETAATDYLNRNTYTQLQAAFKPKISNSLEKPLVFNTSADKLYKDLVEAYNTASLNGALFPKITQNNLPDYVTGKALDGLFLKVANEEKKIRQDASHRVNDLLRKVFSQQ